MPLRPAAYSRSWSPPRRLVRDVIAHTGQNSGPFHIPRSLHRPPCRGWVLKLGLTHTSCGAACNRPSAVVNPFQGRGRERTENRNPGRYRTGIRDLAASVRKTGNRDDKYPPPPPPLFSRLFPLPPPGAAPLHVRIRGTPLHHGARPTRPAVRGNARLGAHQGRTRKDWRRRTRHEWTRTTATDDQGDGGGKTRAAAAAISVE